MHAAAPRRAEAGRTTGMAARPRGWPTRAQALVPLPLLQLLLVLLALAARPVRTASSSSLSLVLHHGATAASDAVGPDDATIEAGGGDPWYFTAVPTVDAGQEQDQDPAQQQQREPKFVWTIDGAPYTGRTVGPISFGTCGEGGIGVELIELRAVIGTSWFDSRDVVAHVACRDGRGSEL
jgi:hypothetical protein